MVFKIGYQFCEIRDLLCIFHKRLVECAISNLIKEWLFKTVEQLFEIGEWNPFLKFVTYYAFSISA